MKQAAIRKWHRRLGVAVALFILLQAGSGMVISLLHVRVHDHQGEGEHGREGEVAKGQDEHHESGFRWAEALEFVHHGAAPFMNLYRILLGAAILLQTVLGVLIWIKIRAARPA